MDFNSLSVTVYTLILLFTTIAVAGVSLTLCVRALLYLSPSAVDDFDEELQGIRLVRSHRTE